MQCVKLIRRCTCWQAGEFSGFCIYMNCPEKETSSIRSGLHGRKMSPIGPGNFFQDSIPFFCADPGFSISRISLLLRAAHIFANFPPFPPLPPFLALPIPVSVSYFSFVHFLCIFGRRNIKSLGTFLARKSTNSTPKCFLN